MSKTGTNAALAGGGFHHVAIKVADFERSVRFYEDIGFKEKVRWGEGDGRGTLLDSGDGNYMEIFAGGKARTYDASGADGALIHVCFRTTDTDRALALAAKAGATITMEAKSIEIKAADGRVIPIRIAFVQAPAGEVIEFFQSELL